MMEQQDVILKVENLSKQYRLGSVGTGTISHDCKCRIEWCSMGKSK